LAPTELGGIKLDGNDSFLVQLTAPEALPFRGWIGSIVVLRSIDFKIAMKKWLQHYGKTATTLWQTKGIATWA
jgi:hypothetical protein